MTRTIAAYTHPAPASGQAPDTAPGYYYVTIRDGDRTGYLAGPFENDHATALATVEPARQWAHQLRPDQAAFSGFGTARLPLDTAAPPTGILNAHLGIAAR
jgi:hypothetical protein